MVSLAGVTALFLGVTGFRAVQSSRYLYPNGMVIYATPKTLGESGLVSEVQSRSREWLRPGGEK